VGRKWNSHNSVLLQLQLENYKLQLLSAVWVTAFHSPQFGNKNHKTNVKYSWKLRTSSPRIAHLLCREHKVFILNIIRKCKKYNHRVPSYASRYSRLALKILRIYTQILFPTSAQSYFLRSYMFRPCNIMIIYRLSQEECAKLRESVP